MTSQETTRYPILPLRGLLVFPTLTLHIDVGRKKSMAALQAAMKQDEKIVLIAQKDMELDNPGQDDLYDVGVLVHIRQLMKLPNGTMRVQVEGLERAVVESYEDAKEFDHVVVSTITESKQPSPEQEALMRTLHAGFTKFSKLSKQVSEDSARAATEINEPGRLADTVATHLPLRITAKQEVLETLDVTERLMYLIEKLENEKEILDLEKKIQIRVKKAMEQTQKEFYLREQMKAIQSELGDKDGKTGEVSDLRKKIESTGFPEATMKNVLKELDRFERIPAQSPESGVIRNYLDWMTSLPWTTKTEDQLDIHRSQEILDRDHDGLEKVKQRILEYLAVRQLTKSLRGPILCLVGPPGVGKTSLAKSIAESLDRKFVRVALGGVRDESEIRGHRRTYIGAMPGRIIQGMKKAGTINPVFLLDEIDKMSNDFRGDPSSAMLEVLDPEQNNSFSDHYIEESYNLSNVLFIATANDLSSIPGPLRDRMEVISLAGYTEMEKVDIAEHHLLPKQMKEHGLTKSKISIKRDVLLDVVRYYTREAGVRSLERTIAGICRKAALQIVKGEKKKVTVTPKNLDYFLGKRKFRHGQAELSNQVGAATGLAYTSVGGDTLQIEVSLSAGKGKLQLTGKLGDVMKESAQTALSYVRSNAESLGIATDFHEKYDIHIHVPEGAVPKDGPSAGITITTALVSALTGRPVKREVGMTGEVTLRGRVLPIGGLKEKTLSAHRAGIDTIIIPKDNVPDMDDIPESIREELTFHPVSQMEEVLAIALEESNYAN
ncbi:ATP-dependent Lon protease [Chryseomicrobium aureum]|uniref:endopeptidase La n=1 Tax=Chryseomicrobium aureum TaxID=1441723 RepID=UPI00195A9B45|nr:endopeptidase La [Chryseomicrobium aureum]MBM7706753.1 ATP-dependent Lon protease [Chryseomicrobium aureum]